MKKTFFLLCACMCGCSDGTSPQVHVEAPDGATFTKNFVQAYVMPETLAGETWQGAYLRLTFDGRTIRNTEDEVRMEYDLLSAKYGDTSYDGYLVPHTTSALGTDCTAIDLVCDKGFDETHAAGSSLGDLVKICAVSFRDFIAGGYERTSVSFPEEFEGLGLYTGLGAAPLCKSLEELRPEDLKLIGPEIYLYFPKKPEAGQYRFTVTVRTESGELRTDIPAEFGAE